MRRASRFVLLTLAIISLGGALHGQGTESANAIADGRKQWLRYDTEVNQIPRCDSLQPSLDSASIVRLDPKNPDIAPIILPPDAAMKMMHTALRNCTGGVPAPAGASYDQAEAFFRKAWQATPRDPRAFRQLAMLLAARDRWKELELLAREQAKQDPSDPWVFLAVGLAFHRGGSPERAAAVFDSAMALMSAPERGRMFAFQRLLARTDSLAYAKGDAEYRARSEKAFWANANPLWSRQSSDPRAEFLSRVTFAELRWSVEEQQVRGADSDRGEAYIRFGPPNAVLALRGSRFGSTPIDQQAPVQRPGEAGVGSRFNAGNTGRQTQGGGGEDGIRFPSPSDVVTYWDYNNGLTLVFWGAPTFGTARFPIDDNKLIDRIVEERAVAFDNIVRERILPMPSRAIRFRAAGDSVDVLLLAQAPVAAIRTGGSSNTPVRADFWLLRSDGENTARDSIDMRPSGIDQRVYRVAPGVYTYRVEATGDGALVAARASASVVAGPDAASGFSLRGFNTSDLLLASLAQPKTPTTRWFDFSVAPLLGPLPKQQNLEVIWENYELGARDGQAQYNVTITLQRQRTQSGRITAAILGFAGSAVGIDRKDDRVTFKFDRTVPSGPAIVDHVSFAIGDTPAGEYLLTFEITDKTSGRKTKRSAPLTIGGA